MTNFNGLGPFMRIEILIDPRTGEYQLDVDGSVDVIKGVLQAVLEQLENPRIVDQLASNDD